MFLLYLALILSTLLYQIHTIVPTRQILLYPNTQDSPSLYMIGLKLGVDLSQGQYILINMDWLANAVDPYHCILVNTTIQLSCTNFQIPEFDISFDKAIISSHNSQITFSRTIIIEVKGTMVAGIQYFLQFALHNTVENIKRFSPSAQLYCLNKQGLIYQENKNFGAISYKPPVLPQLGVSVLNDLSINAPGVLSTLRAQIRINIPIATPQSALIFVIQQPFKFSPSSYLNIDQSENYATNPIQLNSQPDVNSFQIISPNIFYVAFNQRFVANRKFIIEITEIKNPFFLATSNISIYSADFNSLTPLEQYQQLYPLTTVTQTLALTLGLPYDMPMQGPRVFYKNLDNYYKITFNMPMSVPKGYSIRIYIDATTVRYGTAYINFESVDYTTIYQYTSSTITMNNMGPISSGSLIYITFQGYKNSLTNFYVSVTIDTQEVIKAGATNYMFSGRADGISYANTNVMYYQQRSYSSGGSWQDHFRIVSYRDPPPTTTYYSTYYTRFRIYNTVYPTSSGSYVEMYLSPKVQFDPTFNGNTDCYFNGYSAGSAICTVTKTSNYVHIVVRGSTSHLATIPNPFPASYTSTYFYIAKILYPQISTNKYMYQCYYTLFNSSGVNPTTYTSSNPVTILPPRNILTGVTLQQCGQPRLQGYKYTSFLRFTSTTPSSMNYTVNQNQKRVVTLVSRYGFRGMGTIPNQGQYPCTSTIGVKCYYYVGRTDNYYNADSWDKIVIFFPQNQQNTTKFHIIIPDSLISGSNNHRFVYLAGVYNQLTKDYRYDYESSQFDRSSVTTNPVGLQSDMKIDLSGKAGSYRTNISITSVSSSYSNGLNFMVINTAWSLFQNGKSSFTTATQNNANPDFGYNQYSPVSVLMGDGMYMTVIPFICSSCPSTFTFNLNNLHMPYHYDLPNYYMYIIDASGWMIASNQFEMTNGNIFYQAHLKSLTVSCQANYLGAKNTVCQIKFGTQSPLKADANITVVLSGMNIATDVCQVFLPNGTQLQTTCTSTKDNKNVSIQLTDKYNAYHYPSDNFTMKIRGLSIQSDTISQSVTVYVHDKTGKYIIQKGTRIFTTTVARPQNIEIYEIVYDYLSPLSSNKLTITFFLPRGLHTDEKLGFTMGKDLSDVNLQIKRLKIILTRTSDGVIIENTNQMISAQYKILFTLRNPQLLITGNYSLQIYGIMTPSSHQNGAFSIIYQRAFDKAFTLINNISTSFPEFGDRKISDISMQSFFNSEGLEQQIVFTLRNLQAQVNDQMIWIINFPSYYSQKLFNAQPYCLIDIAPIQCYADPTTPYQMIIKNSPKIIAIQTTYTISLFRLASPRSIYTNDKFPSRYLFIGGLVSSSSQAYAQTSLLYPEQAIQQFISGALIIQDVTVTTLTQPSFSSIYAIISLSCNVDITATSFIYLIFPSQFDNFNNNPISIILKKLSPLSILYAGLAQVIDRTLYFQINTNIVANTKFTIQLPSLPTPKVVSSVAMSNMLGFVTTSDRKSIYAASAASSNSAPILAFQSDPRYISFNHDTTIDITAGTYSNMIDVQSSDGEQFLTNIVINITSIGFTFQPKYLFLKLGDDKTQFRVGADQGLLPISYFYQTTKSQQVITYYTITKNNNIRVTNTPVSITLPLSIDVPIGGCSSPQIININNAPVTDLQITFNYDNSMYLQNLFWPNQHLTNSNMKYTPNIIQNSISFCVHQSVAGLIAAGTISSTFKIKLVLSGTNYASYRFTPTENITINFIAATIVPAPVISSLITINKQKTFLTFNITTNVKGIIYYNFMAGNKKTPLTDPQIKILIKNNNFTIKAMSDYLQRLYLTDRDERVGYLQKNSGQHTLTIKNLLPQRYYTLCLYLQTQYNVITKSKCISTDTQNWGNVLKASVTFTNALSDENLNKILCFYAKQVDTEVKYLVDLQGNSCDNRKVKNLYYEYPGQTFSSQQSQTYIYMLTNPNIASDPSTTAFARMYNNSNVLSSTSLASAISGFGINYLSSKYISSIDGITLLQSSKADALQVSFDKPEYLVQSNSIKISGISLTGQGSVYFLLILYKQIVVDGNNSYVNIRLSAQPSKQQIINCENWEGLLAEGCARAIYSSTTLAITFKSIKPNCMYILYYITANQYPLRPILGTQIINNTIVTFTSQIFLLTRWFIFSVIMTILVIIH